MFDQPFVSVIVPNRNGKDILEVCLSSLERLNYPNYETVVVDNGTLGAYYPQSIQKNMTKMLAGQRFDNLAAAAQEWLEELPIIYGPLRTVSLS